MRTLGKIIGFLAVVIGVVFYIVYRIARMTLILGLLFSPEVYMAFWLKMWWQAGFFTALQAAILLIMGAIGMQREKDKENATALAILKNLAK